MTTNILIVFFLSFIVYLLYYYYLTLFSIFPNPSSLLTKKKRKKRMFLMGIEKWAKYLTHQPKRAMGPVPHPCPSATAQTEARLVRSKTQTWKNEKAHTRPVNPYPSKTENRIFSKRYPIQPIKTHYKGKDKVIEDGQLDVPQ